MTSKQPKLDVLFGELYEDHWTSPSVAINIKPSEQRRTIRGLIWNPYFNPKYMRNKVAVSVDGEIIFHDLMFAGGALRVERELRPREEMLFEVESEASLNYDPLDSRGRGVILKLSEVVHRPGGKSAPAPSNKPKQS